MAHQENPDGQPVDMAGPHSPHFSAEVNSENIAPWTEVEEGRYMPRRIRGSFQGRALG
jgi:hypothetical protein